ncbi:hypothetical protein [Roseomonas rosulenta]|uniref:hypothetical protein n=1 Tax=Roseomonas rosulenta TaxID=2748667 RepID=UPI0018DEFA36|nr:hypothetical protein [Roseomonas rosulenta]
MRRRTLLLPPFLAPCQSMDTDRTTTSDGVVGTVNPRSRELLLRGPAGAQAARLLTVIAGGALFRL